MATSVFNKLYKPEPPPEVASDSKATLKVPKNRRSLKSSKEGVQKQSDKNLIIQNAILAELNLPKVLEEQAQQVRNLTIKQFIQDRRKRLYESTALDEETLKIFEKVYKLAYRIKRYNLKYPWLKRISVLFFGELHAVFFSKELVLAQSILTVGEIMHISVLKQDMYFALRALGHTIISMGIMYNNGELLDEQEDDKAKSKNSNKVDVLMPALKIIRDLGLIEEKIYKEVKFILSVYDGLYGLETIDFKRDKKIQYKQNPAKVKLSNGETIDLTDRNTVFLFKSLFIENYIKIMQIYMKLQKPYLIKFYLLWENKDLDKIKSTKQFYSFTDLI